MIQTAINKVILSPIVQKVTEQEKMEGDFRQRHMEVRSNVEAIAFYRAGVLENIMTNQKLKGLVNVQKSLTEWRMALNSITNMFDYFGGILSYLIIGVPVFITHLYDDMEPAELNGIVSRVSPCYLFSAADKFAKLEKWSAMFDRADMTSCYGEEIRWKGAEPFVVHRFWILEQ